MAGRRWVVEYTGRESQYYGEAWGGQTTSIEGQTEQACVQTDT